MDSTVQTVQEVGNQVSQYRQMFENYLPDITKFGIKVVLEITDKIQAGYRSGTVYVLTGQDRTLHTPDL